MDILKSKLIILIFFLISACSSIPTNTSNSCSIFDERYFWYKHSKKVEQKWGTPIYIQLAIIKMESDFDWLAKPARKKIFKVIRNHCLIIHKVFGRSFFSHHLALRVPGR